MSITKPDYKCLLFYKNNMFNPVTLSVLINLSSPKMYGKQVNTKGTVLFTFQTAPLPAKTCRVYL